ncbi:MFS transporter [Oryzomicrobium sp.]|uniref:MFS transporter n=1 Tax=Oryzomicrobium sp. TaxID=1911578 RepID=UPI002FE23CC9
MIDPAPADPAPGHHLAGWHERKKRLLMLLLPAIAGVEFLESGMFVFAASHIAGGVDAAPREFAQVLAAYAIGSMMMIAMQQWLARHFGYRRYLAAAFALFVAGAVASALAEGLQALTLARLVEGFGGGALFTSSRILVMLLFAPAERPRALRHFIVVLFGLSALGPALSGWLVESWGWRWVFAAPVPLMALAAAGAWMLLPDAVGRSGEPVRWAAGPLLLFAAAITLVQLGLSEARYDVFLNPLHLIALALAGLLLLGWFAAHQWGHDEPLLRLRELRHPAYLLGLGFYFMHYCMSNASSYVFPILAERGLGMPLSTVGLLNSFAAAVTWAAAFAYVRFGSKLPAKRPLMAAGAAALALSAWLLASQPPDVNVAALLPALAAKGVFGALFVLPVAGLTFRELGEERFAPGYQGKNLMRQLAGSFGTSLAAIALTDLQFSAHTQLAGGMEHTVSAGWIAALEAGFAARGFSPGEAHAAALAEVARLIGQQTLLLACDEFYRLLAVLAALVLVAVLAQRRFR